MKPLDARKPDRTHCEACGKRTMQLRGAERLADAVEAAMRLGLVDSRSPMADALLDYRDPIELTPISEVVDEMMSDILRKAKAEGNA